MKMKSTAAVVAVVAMLAACVARREPADARGVAFPVREDSYRKDGIVVATETVRLVQPGMGKDQVRQLLGAPHFTEGLFFVHDWNYLLKLSQPGGWLDCQLQVQFDEHDRVRASYWKSGDCEKVTSASTAAAQSGAPVVTQAAPQPTAGAEQIAAFAQRNEGDLRFAFGRSEIDDLRPADRERLHTLATQVGAQADQVRRIEIVGHADRLGSVTRKYRRSLARAEAVAHVFVAQGVDPRRIAVVGRSDKESVTQCAGTKDRAALQACLAPDRQVVVSISLEPGSEFSSGVTRQ